MNMETPNTEKKNIPKRRARLTPAGKEKERLADEEKKKIESTESADTEVSHEKEKSPDEELIEKIEQATESGDMDKIKDVLIDLLEKENKGGTLSDYNSDDEIKNHLQETLEELKGKSKKEEQSETVSATAKPEKSKDPKEMTPEEKVKEEEVHQKAMADKEMLYSTKIDLMEDDANKDTKEVKKELHRTVGYVNKEKVKENCAEKINELIKLSYKEEAQKKEGEGKTEYENKMEELAKEMNLPPEEIQTIMTTQKANLEELSYQQAKKEKSKKESKWKKFKRLLPKIALYGGVAALGIATGGVFGVAIGVGMGAFRIGETLLKDKKGRKDQDAAILESKKMLLGEIDETDMSEIDKKEKDASIQAFYDDIFVRLSVAKQNQIDKKGEEHSLLGTEIQIFEDEEYKPNDEKSKEELQKLYSKRRGLHKEQIKKYLEAQGGLSAEDIDKRVKLSGQLVEMEDNQSVMELDFSKRKVSAVGKIFTKIDSVLSSPLLLGGSRRGGNQSKEKLITASIFAVAGVLARSCPIARNVLMAYAGMKLGSAAANLFVSHENKEMLKQVSAESINLNSNMDDISRAKAQLLDPKFKEENPAEHAKLQEKVFAIDRAKMEKLLGSSEGDEDGGYIGETNKKLEETIKKKRAAKGAQKGMKIFLGVAGGAAGWLVGDYIGDKMEDKKAEAEAEKEAVEAAGTTEKDPNVMGGGKETSSVNLDEEMRKAEEELAKEQAELAQLQAEAERIAELNKEIIVQKGDTSWSMAEDGLEKRAPNWDSLSRAEKDYAIDWYKDKMVADPDLIGIDGSNASSLKIGDEIDIAKIFSDPNEMTEVISKAQGLSPEAIKNIMDNREIIGNVMSGKLEDASGADLIKVMNIMGGSEQSGAGFVQELQNRATEIIGANASPEQVQTILHNPDLFGRIMDAEGLDKITDGDLGLATRVFANNPELIGKDFVNQINVSGVDSPLNDHFIERVTSLNEEIGHISETQTIENIIQPYKDELQMRGEKFVELTNKNTSGFGGSIRRFFGLNGRILQEQESFEQAAEDYHAQVISRNGYSKELLGLGDRCNDLTNDGTLSETATEYANKVSEDVSNVEESLNKLNTGLIHLDQEDKLSGAKEVLKKVSKMVSVKMRFNTGIGKWVGEIDTSKLGK